MGTSVLFGYLSLPYPSQKGLGAVLVTLEESTPIRSLFHSHAQTPSQVFQGGVFQFCFCSKNEREDNRAESRDPEASSQIPPDTFIYEEQL